jgi:uncharacterized membrane protein
MRLPTARADEPRLLRLLKHRCLDERDARRLLDEAALDRLQQRIALSERLHQGEIRICIEAGLPLSYLWRRATPRDRAVALFAKLGVWDTEHNNGVLIYLLLAEHAIEIVADRGRSAWCRPAIGSTRWRSWRPAAAPAATRKACCRPLPRRKRH